MKYVLFIAMLIGFSTSGAFAQTKEAKESEEDEKAEMKATVPAVVLQAFAKDYPGKKAKWDAEDQGFEAMFTVNGVEASASYSKTGHLESAEMEILVSELPAAAKAYALKNYSTYKLTEAAKMTDDKNVVTYEAEVKKDGKSMDLIFDANGSFIKQVKGE